MRQPIPLSFAKATRSLQSSQATLALLDEIADLSESAIQELAPLIFEVMKMENHYLGIKALKTIIEVRPEWINHKDAKANTPLMEAVKSNALDLVEILLDAGAKTSPRNKEGLGVLDIAARLSANPRWQAAMGESLFEKAKFTQAQKDRALYHAGAENNLGMARVLLAQGARFGLKSKTGTALIAASLNPYNDNPSPAIVRAMLDTKEGKQIIDFGWGVCQFGAAIHGAALTGNLPTLEILIDAGAALNPPESVRDTLPITPLMSAASGLHPDAIEFLIKSGADATLVDSSGGNVLHHLANSQLNLDKDTEVPLMLKALDLLIQAGADPLQENKHGHTPARTALNASRPELSAALGALASSRRLQSSTPDPEQKDPVPGPRL